MKSNFDDIKDIEDAEEERKYLERRAQQRERALQERKRREQKNRRLKLLICIGIPCVIITVCITVICIKMNAGSQKEEENLITEAVSEEAANDQIAEGNEISEEIPGKDEVQDNESTQDNGEVAGNDLPQFQFESTANTTTIYSENVISSHAILVDVNADTIIASKGAFDRISPASMTKVLTVLVAAEAITAEQLNDTFTMTLEITDYSYVNDCSNVGFLAGEVVTVKDLFYGTILPSGGDAAVGLATYVSGSHEAFVDRMNQKLEELGLAESAHFTNCVGLYDENHYCTVHDMAVIMKAAMQNEWCREVLSAHTYTTTPTTEHPEGITISNWFLRRIEDKDTGGLVVGGKTGYVVQSGNCAVSYEESAQGTPYICVTAGAHSSWRCIYDHVEIYNQYIPDED